MLNVLNWEPLRNRREAHRLTCMYKMMNGQLDIDYRAYTSPKPDRCRRGHSNQFIVPSAGSDVYANSFFPRTLKAWNELPEKVVTKTPPHTFKAAVLQELSVLK